MRFKTMCIGIVAGLLINTLMAKEFSEDVKAILGRNKKANGPEESIKKINNVTKKYKLELPGLNVSGKMTTTTQWPRCQKVESSFQDNMKVVKVFNGKKGWELKEDVGLREITGNELQAELFMMKLGEPEVDMTDLFSEITLDPVDEMIDGMVCYKLICTPVKSSGLSNPITVFIDKIDYLIRRVDAVTIDETGQFPWTSIIEAYTEYDGVKVAQVIKLDQVGISLVVTLESVEFNRQLPPDTFAKPVAKSSTN